MSKKQTIAIIGGGFGGLRTALDLCKKLRKHNVKNYEVVLIDKQKHHTFTPLLYEVAAAPKTQASIQELHDLAVHRFSDIAQHPGRFLRGEVINIDTQHRTIQFADGQDINYSYLVVAPGSETNYFNIPGLQKYAHSFKTFEDAISIREKIWELTGENEQVKVVIGGGGPTGVELAGELALWCDDLQEESTCKVHITLIDANERVLSPFSKKVSVLAMERLKKLGVNLKLNQRITKTTKKTVKTSSGQYPYDVFVWSGGIQASSLASALPGKKASRGQAAATNKMQCVPRDKHLHRDDRTYIIGDSACIRNPKTGNQVPAVARAAIEQGKVAAHNIFAHILQGQGKKAPAHKEYQPYSYPYIVPVGGKYAIATIGPFVLRGFWAWIFKGLVELNYFRSILPLSTAIGLWLRGLWIFTRNDRLG